MKLLVLAALVAVAFSQPLDVTENDLQEWENFKVKFAKVYTADEEAERQSIFLNRLKGYKEHNARYEKGEVTYTVGVNKFSDWTREERLAYTKRGLKRPANQVSSGKVFAMPDNVEIPKTVDWRTKGAVTPVKDQGMCGSCWAFSATGALEGQYFIKNQKLVSFSEQNLVDCSGAEGNYGCAGGWPDWAYAYIVKNKGIETEADYPYAGYDQSCKYKKKKVAATISNSTDIPTGNEKKLAQAVANVGPISVCIDASQETFLDYTSGVYNEPSCMKEHDELDHCVLAVGYGTQKKGGAYWLVKNSW